jgi:F420-dependent oxidoreductase-like protein
VRFSVWPSASQSWPDLSEVAAYAASSGWDGLWVADHFMPASGSLDAPMLECWAVLAGLATSVPRVRLGSLVAGNTYRHPAVLANMAATIDQLSGGRLVLGLGSGWQENEHAAYGLEFFDTAGRLARLEEACAVIHGLLTEQRANFDGRYYHLVDAPLDPKGAGRRLPLLVGGGGEKVTLRIVARWADEWNTWGTPDVLATKGAVLERHCEALGRDPAEIARSAQVMVNLDGAAPPSRPMPTLTVSAGEMQEQLAAYAEAGVDEFILPDWNLGRGQARRDALDHFLADVAGPFRHAG